MPKKGQNAALHDWYALHDSPLKKGPKNGILNDRNTVAFDAAKWGCICLCEKASVYIEKRQINKTIGTCTSLYQGSYQMWSNTEYLIHLHPLSGEGAFWGRGCIFCAVLEMLY